MDSGLREEILSILKGAGDMTTATIRPDGYPQATTVSYVSEGLVIYFGCAAESQKARNLALNDKVSLTVTLPYFNWDEIRGLSLGGRATPVTDRDQSRERAHASEVPTDPAIRIGRQEGCLSGSDYTGGHFSSRLSQRVWPHRSRETLMMAAVHGPREVDG
jgi:hypothetical protein